MPAVSIRVRRLAVELDGRVDRVAGGAGHGADDHALVVQEGVDDGGLADVGPPHDGQAADRVVAGDAAGGQPVDDVVEQFGDGEAVVGADRPGLAEAEGVEVGGGGGQALVVGLVGGDVDGLAGVAQEAGDVGVGGGGAGLHVDDQADGVGLAEGLVDLRGDLAGVGAGQLLAEQAARIDDAEGDAAPLGGGVEPVAGRAGQVLDDGAAPAEDAVEERGLADVGPPDEGEQGQPGQGVAGVGVAGGGVAGGGGGAPAGGWDWCWG